MKYLIIISILYYSVTSLAIENDRRNELIRVIDEELGEVTRLNKQTRGRRPTLLLRMSELLLEKGRIIKEDEAERFLKLSIDQRRKLKRVQVFPRSIKYFKKAEKVCLFILKKFRKFKYKSEVYYILAFNSKEFGSTDRAKTYFEKAIKNSKPGTRVHKKSLASLAEIYFNRHKYNKAISSYEKSLLGKKDKWWTKDAYNLAWSYFRVKKTSKAISLMHKIYDLRGNRNFVDMSKDVEKYLGYFYVEAGQIKTALSFYRKSGRGSIKNLISLSKLLIDKASYNEAEKILLKLKKEASEIDDKKDVDINLMNLYSRVNNYNKHLQVCQYLVSLYSGSVLTPDEVELVKLAVSRNAAILQQQAIGKTYRHQKTRRLQKANLSKEYFKLKKILDPKSSNKTDFHIAETLYATGLYDEAIEYYRKAIQGSAEKNDKKTKKLASNGLLSTLGKRGVSAKTKAKYTAQVYEAFLRESPKSKKSFVIYQRLFSRYHEKGDMKGSENVLMKFKSNFPKAIKTQEAMLAKIMDYYKDKKDEQRIKYWVKKINNNDVYISKAYSKKLNLLLITMQFEDVEKANSKGDKKKALRGYLTIYKDSKSSKIAKKNAAYNIAILFHELGDTKRTYDWAKKSLDLMNSSDIMKFEKSYLAFGSTLFSKRRFDLAIDIYKTSFTKLCNKRSKDKKLFFKNTVVIFLSAKKVEQAYKFIRESEKCRIDKKTIQDTKLEILILAKELRKWSVFDEIYLELQGVKRIWPKLIHPLYFSYKRHLSKGNHKKSAKVKKEIITYYNLSKNNKLNIPLEGLDVVANFKLAKLEQIIEKIKLIKLQFPEKKFNKLLKRKFEILDQITSNALTILEIRSGKGMVKAYRYLVESYRFLINEIILFSPANRSVEYVNSFRTSMKKLVEPLKKRAEDFYSEARRQIKKNKIISNDSYWFLAKEKSDKEIRVEYNYIGDGEIMDRGGI